MGHYLKGKVYPIRSRGWGNETEQTVSNLGAKVYVMMLKSKHEAFSHLLQRGKLRECRRGDALEKGGGNGYLTRLKFEAPCKNWYSTKSWEKGTNGRIQRTKAKTKCRYLTNKKRVEDGNLANRERTQRGFQNWGWMTIRKRECEAVSKTWEKSADRTRATHSMGKKDKTLSKEPSS